MDEAIYSEVIERLRKLEEERSWLQESVRKLEEKLESETGELSRKLAVLQQESRPPWKRARA